MSQDGDMKPLQSFLNVSQLKLRKEGYECMIKYMRKKCLYLPTYITRIQRNNLFSPQVTWHPNFSSHLRHRDTLLFHSQCLVVVGFTLSFSHSNTYKGVWAHNSTFSVHKAPDSLSTNCIYHHEPCVGWLLLSKQCQHKFSHVSDAFSRFIRGCNFNQGWDSNSDRIHLWLYQSCTIPRC